MSAGQEHKVKFKVRFPTEGALAQFPGRDWKVAGEDPQGCCAKIAVIHCTASPQSQKQRASGMSDGSLPSTMKSIRLPDAIHHPPMYGGTGLFVAEDFAGVKVFRSKDGLWNAAQYLRLVPWNDSIKLLTATKQIGNALDMNLIPFGNSAIPDTAGNAGHFLFPDITAQVSALLTT